MAGNKIPEPRFNTSVFLYYRRSATGIILPDPITGPISYTPRYASDGNRYWRSLNIPIASTGVGEQTLCNGDCIEGTQYGDPDTSKSLTYEFPGQSPVTIPTFYGWISFDVDAFEAKGSRDTIYETSLYRNIRGYNRPPLNNYRGFFGDEDVFLIRGPAYWQVETIQPSIDPPNLFSYRISLFQSSDRDNWIWYWEYDPPSYCWEAGPMNIPGAMWETFDYFTSYAGESLRWDHATEDTIDSYNSWFYACNGTPDPSLVRIRVYDPTGLIHTGYGTNDVDLPAVQINQEGGGLVAKSQTFPGVWYDLGTAAESCECSDYIKQVLKPDWLPFRDWTNSNAGSPVCKHMMAGQRYLGNLTTRTNYYYP